MHIGYELGFFVAVVYFVVFPYAEACPPETSTTAARRKRETTENVIVVLTTNQPYEEANKDIALEVVRQELAQFARQQGLPKSNKQIVAEAVDVGGKFAAKFTIENGDCERAKAFVGSAVNSVAGVSGAIINCHNGQPVIFKKQ